MKRIPMVAPLFAGSASATVLVNPPWGKAEKLKQPAARGTAAQRSPAASRNLEVHADDAN